MTVAAFPFLLFESFQEKKKHPNDILKTPRNEDVSDLLSTNRHNKNSI